jgi:uncharacterized protein
MKTISGFVKDHAFVLFVVLAYLFSWWPGLLGAGLLPHGPLLAALLVVGLGEGKTGLKIWWSRVAQRGIAGRWYAVAAAIPLVITFTAAGINLLLGAQLPAQIDWAIPFTVLPIMLLLSGMWEEPGWTGFGLPHLYAHFGPSVAGTLTATAIMAAVRSGWHLPLVLSGSIYWSDFVLIIGFQIVFAWLFNRTGGAVPAIMFSHLLNNIFSGAFVGRLFTGADWVLNSWLQAGLWSLLAIGLLLVVGLELGRRSAAQVEMSLPAHVQIVK